MVQSKEEKAAYSKLYRAKNKEKIKIKNRIYNEKNKEKIKEYKKAYQKQHYLKNKERITKRIKAYNQTAKGKKVQTISDWKYRGVIGDLSTIYDDRYLPSTNCEVCNKTYASSTDRCLDHCHITGEFRQILCQSCNVMDNWKKIIEEKRKLAEI